MGAAPKGRGKGELPARESNPGPATIAAKDKARGGPRLECCPGRAECRARPGGGRLEARRTGQAAL